jgi:hypothetical protein
MKSND